MSLVALPRTAVRKLLKTREGLGHCSWCISKEPVLHVSEERYLLFRDLYHCTVCQNKTAQCREDDCPDFARGYEGISSDEKCFLHAGLIKDWGGSSVRDSLNITRYCSWCFTECPHRLNHHQKKLYECTTCFRVGSPCIWCANAMSRNGAIGGEKCLRCASLIKGWSSVEKQAFESVGWCSICYEHGPHSLMKENTLSADDYCCNTCNLPTQKCSSCKTNFVRKSTILRPDCPKCKDSTWNWDLIRERKNIFLIPLSIDDIKLNLSRESPEKTQARNFGMLRPFLLLVSMHAAVRNTIGLSLGLSLLTTEEFGDSHKESWYLLSHPKAGMIVRGTERFENITNEWVCWYFILQRVEASHFKGRNLGSKLDRPDALVASSQKACPIEVDMMDRLASHFKANLNEEKIFSIEFLLRTPSFKAFKETMTRNGIKSGLLHEWLVEMIFDLISQNDQINNLTKLEPDELVSLIKVAIDHQIIQGQGYFTTKKRHDRMATNAAQAVGTMAVQKLIIFPFSPVLGFAVMFFCIGDMVTNSIWGGNVEMLIPSTQQILVQRLALSLFDLNIDDFY